MIHRPTDQEIWQCLREHGRLPLVPWEPVKMGFSVGAATYIPYYKIAIGSQWNDLGTNFGIGTAIDGSTEKYAIAFVPGVDFTLAKVAFKIYSVTGTPVAYDVRIETDNGAGRPSGTLAWANATAQLASGASAGWTAELTLTASGVLDMATMYHMVIQPASDPAGAYISINETGEGAKFRPYNFMGEFYNGSAWSNLYCPIFMLVSSDGTPERWGQPLDSSALTYLTDTAWRGVKFTAPATMDIMGIRFGGATSTTQGLLSAKLIDSGNNILATGSLPAGWGDLMGSGYTTVTLLFPSKQTLTSGQVYRIAMKDTGSSGHRILEYYTSRTGTPDYSALKLGGSAYITTYGTSSDGIASPTSWTDLANSEPIGFEILVDSIAAGGGGSVGPWGTVR